MSTENRDTVMLDHSADEERYAQLLAFAKDKFQPDSAVSEMFEPRLVAEYYTPESRVAAQEQINTLRQTFGEANVQIRTGTDETGWPLPGLVVAYVDRNAKPLPQTGRFRELSRIIMHRA